MMSITRTISLRRPTTSPRRDAPRLNALTIDVEDYYHVSGFEGIVDRCDWDRFESRIESSTHTILEIFHDRKVRATFFILGWVAERHPDLVRAIRAAGHEVGSHGYWHRLIYTQSPHDFRADLRRSCHILEDVLGEPIISYRAPSFSITPRTAWALDVLIQEGIRIDSSIYPTHHDRYGWAGAPLAPCRLLRAAGSLLEFPMAVCRVFGYPLPVGGGGYLRLYPYGLTRRGLRAINAADRAFCAYLHPWEVDPAQPRLNPGWMRAFRHYVNLHRTAERLQRLCSDFRLGTLSEALAALDGHLPTWNLAA
jgi:polysaccharide deacetylase family protein (PEP-CTERM system associated)